MKKGRKKYKIKSPGSRKFYYHQGRMKTSGGQERFYRKVERDGSTPRLHKDA